ncbi:MAG: hypothetical protein IKF82_00665 [Bacilli bacterium]|nr:hypothetical protein [Bacilli bacterium]
MSRLIYQRNLKNDDFLDFGEQIIFFKDSNIAYIIVEKNSNYIIRKKKIFNNHQIDERTVKTVSQVLKIVN